MNARRYAILSIAFLSLAGREALAQQAPRLPQLPRADACARLADGIIRDSDGRLLSPTVDEWGYDYEHRTYEGTPCTVRRGAVIPYCWAYDDHRIRMRWNEAWLSSRDCDFDGRLDRHAGYESYVDSGAMLETTSIRRYTSADGRVCEEHLVTRYEAVPFDAVQLSENWYDHDGRWLGRAIWNEFYVAEAYVADTCVE